MTDSTFAIGERGPELVAAPSLKRPALYGNLTGYSPGLMARRSAYQATVRIRREIARGWDQDFVGSAGNNAALCSSNLAGATHAASAGPSSSSSASIALASPGDCAITRSNKNWSAASCASGGVISNSPWLEQPGEEPESCGPSNGGPQDEAGGQ